MHIDIDKETLWFLCLPLLLSLFCPPLNKSTNSLAHLSKPGSDTGNFLEELRLPDSLAGENKFPCSSLLDILELAPS